MNFARRISAPDHGAFGRLLALLAVLLFPAITFAGIDWKNPPQGVFVDDWMIVEIDGQQTGYVHSQFAREGDVIATTNLMSLELRRAGSRVPIKTLQTTRETLDGTALSFTSRMDMSAQAMHKQGRIEDGRLHIRSNQFGMESANEYAYPQGAVMSWGAMLAQESHGYEPGTEYSVQIFEPSFSESAPIPVEVKIGEPEKVEVNGEIIDAIRATQNMLGMSSVTWVDKDGRIVRTQLPMMGLSMIMTRSTREQALAEFDAPEFFMPTTIKSPRAIDRKNSKKIDYVLRLKDASVEMPKLPTTAMQTPHDAKADSVKITVKRLDHAALAKTPVQEYPESAAEFLRANTIINSDDPAVIAMAKEARGDAKTPYEIADRLRVYVTDIIVDKTLDVGFATASEVCRNKQGDCSEHAVLLAALGRACGIPTRVVTGIVYVPIFGGDEDIFGFHMWTQFMIGDTWVDFDAAQRESDCNATHIAFDVSSLEGAGLGQIAINLVNLIGNLDIDITGTE